MPDIMLIAAHPDDETIGAASVLMSEPRLILVHVTDGAPTNMYDAARCGFGTREEYAAARRREVDASLEELGTPNLRRVELGVPDQAASFQLAEIALRITTLVVEHRPEIVMTHPYEGGHPDHDATAFAVAAARGLARVRFNLREFTSYHAVPDGIRTGEFLDHRGDIEIVELTSEQRERKRRATATFATQAETLAQFGIRQEQFRPAPEYDFERPPHTSIYYERFDWGMDFQRFKALVRSARRRLQRRAA